MKYKCSFCNKPFKAYPCHRRAKEKFCNSKHRGLWQKQNRKKRFLTHVNKTNNCWEWLASKHPFGYGQFIRSSAHRWSFKFHVGKIPKGKYILHNCDNPSCVNPKHLRIGSQKENIVECSIKDRISFGIKRPNSKLTDENVLKIRKLYATSEISQMKLAQKFNVSQRNIFNILHNVRWKRVK